MKDSQLRLRDIHLLRKYIKANNERFSTNFTDIERACISISRRIMKDSQLDPASKKFFDKYIKANNERFSTSATRGVAVR